MELLSNMTTSQWTALSPAISYFVGSLFFQFLETFKIWEQYRLVPSEEELTRNRVSRSAVITYILIYHSITTALSLAFVDIFPPLKECQNCFGSIAYWQSSISALLKIKDLESVHLVTLSWVARLTYLGFRQFLSFCIFDTWIYWTHYFAHHNRWWFSKATPSNPYFPRVLY
jgi:sphinganine C4-monooxygenase